MIICVCNNVSEKNIRHAVASGMRSMSDLRTHLDVGTCCGKCTRCAKSVLKDCLDQPAMLPCMVRQVSYRPQALAA